MNETIKVFIVDDSKMGQAMLAKMLTDLGPNVKIVGEASTASGAIFMLEDDLPDMVMLKLNIPGDIGSEDALRQIKEVDPNIYIVVCPMPQDREDLDGFIRSGKADNFLAKPIKKPVLERLVTAFYQRRASQ